MAEAGGAEARKIKSLPAFFNAEGMTVLSVPSIDALFVADLFLPIPLDDFPVKSELALNDFFVRWLEESELKPTMIFGVHGGVGTEEHLEKIRSLRRE